MLRPAPEKLAQRPDNDASDDRTRNASIPRLARLLWRLMNNASLHLVAPYSEDTAERTIGEEFRALTRAAAKIEVAPGIELGRVLWTHGDALHSRRALAGIRELGRRWPRGHAPQGFLALFAKAFQGSTIFPAGSEPIDVANRVQSPSVRDNSIQGPYLVIVVIGQYPEAHGYAPLRAYAQPIYSGVRFIPVESNFERAVLQALLRSRRVLAREGVDLALEKPIFDRLTPLGACRPDFLVEARSQATGEIRQLVIQAMPRNAGIGSTPATQRALEQIAPALPITPRDVEDDQVARLIAEALHRLN